MGGHLCARHLHKLLAQEIVIRMAVANYDKVDVLDIVSRMLDGA